MLYLKNGLTKHASFTQTPGVYAMKQIFRFNHPLKRDAAVSAWLNEQSGELGTIARYWFDVIRDCGDDVRELLHDGHPAACVIDAAFVYVDAFRNHVNVGFFRGTELPDPNSLLEGTGKFMRHVKLRPAAKINSLALSKLISAAYVDMKRCLQSE